MLQRVGSIFIGVLYFNSNTSRKIGTTKLRIVSIHSTTQRRIPYDLNVQP